MKLDQLQENWEELARLDPMWAICADRKDWDRTEFFASGIEEINGVMKRVESLSPEIHREKALDFGCGIGRLTQAFAQYFEKCYGVDISRSMVEMARQANDYGEQCEYIHNDKGNLSLFNDDFFDMIYCSRVLQHMEPQYAMNYMGEFIRLLKPGGMVVFQLPSAQFGLKKWFKILLPNRIVNILRRAVYKSTAVAEMYTVDKDFIVRVVEEHGGKVTDIVENQALKIPGHFLAHIR